MSNADSPGTLSVTGDYAKTIITLASAILAVTATFGSSLIEHAVARLLWLLVVSMGALMISIVCSTLVLTEVVSQTRAAEVAAAPATGEAAIPGSKAWNRLARRSNAAFLFLVIGLIALLFLGILTRAAASPDDLAAAVKAALATPGLPCKATSADVRSARFDDADRHWEVLLRLRCGRVATFSLVTVTEQKVTSVEMIPAS